MASSPVPPLQPLTVIEPEKFEAITPGQFITFTTESPLINRRLLHRQFLRFAILDSPNAYADAVSPVIAAMIVPRDRETDWTFCSESGHIQLLYQFYNVTRLILIGNNPPTDPGLAIYARPSITDTDKLDEERLVNELKPLLKPLHPKASSNSNNGSPETLFLPYEDGVTYRVTVATLKGPIVGEFLVEDVELVVPTYLNKQLRRGLRFKRMPTLVQSQALLLPNIPEGTTETELETLRNIEGATFRANTSILVHQPLIHMVAGLFLIVKHLEHRFDLKLFPSALCLGIGGGVLLNFLRSHMGFAVTGVEADKAVLTAAREHFGLSPAIRVIVGDAIEVVQNFPMGNIIGDRKERFDVIFVDLDSSDAKIGLTSPPPEFINKAVFEGLRSLLDDGGALIINVIPLNHLFYRKLVEELKEVFHNVYGINAQSPHNSAVIAIPSPNFSDINDDNMFLERLKSRILEPVMNSIMELRINP